MRWHLRIATVGLVLVLVGGVALPSLFPIDRDYGYDVRPEDESYAPTESNYTVIRYDSLSVAEQRVFDAALANDSTVWLDDEVDGTTLTTHTDAPRFGNGFTAVSRDGRTYVVSGTMVRRNQDIHQFGGPFLILLGFVCCGSGAVALVIDRIRGSV